MKTIPLTQGYFTKVDDEDYEKFAIYRWHVNLKNGEPRAVRAKKILGKYIGVTLSREILNPPIDKYVDHINGDTLDNRKCNLRICTSSENARNRKKSGNNTSGYKGVYIFRQGKCKKIWRAFIYKNKKQIFLGDFEDKILAAKEYNKAAIKYHGAFAKLNIID